MGMSSTRVLTSLAILLALPLGAQDASVFQRRRELPARKGPGALSGHDRADLRRDWNLVWFGGQASPAYLDYKNQLAAQERTRWANLFPTGSRALLAAPGLVVPAAAGAGTWVNLGPTANLTTANFPDIDSGRPVAVVAHPTANTLYLATSGGGVFKCTNADVTASTDWTWTALTDALPASGSSGNVSVGALTMSPADPLMLYLGMGDAFDAQGRGFFKSSDGGTTWTAATGLGNATRSYAILPLTATRILWGTNDGLKVSNDGGATFANVTGGPSTGKAWTVQKLSASELVCSVESANVGAIYYSSDAGATWQATTLPVTGAVRITLATSPASGTAVWGIYEDTTSGKVAKGLLKSTDKGTTWTWVAAPTASGGLFQGTGGGMTSDGGQGFYNHGLAVDPTNANRVFVGSNLALYRTLDAGATWAQMTHWYGSGHVYTHADFHAAGWSSNGATLYMAHDGGLSVVRDPFRIAVPTGPTTSPYTPSDVTFIDNRRNKGLISHLVYNIGSTTATTPTDSKWRVTLGLQDNGTRVRQPNTPGGSLTGSEGTFEDQVGGDGFATLINPANGNLMLGSIYYTRIYKSTDGGATPFNPSSTGIVESNSSTLAPFQPRLAPGDTAHPNTVYTATNGTVYKSMDFGDTWTGLPTTNLPPGGTGATSDPTTALYIRNIGAAAGDSNAIGIAANQGRVYLSYNGGSSWTQGGALTNNGSYTSSIWFDRITSQTAYVASVAPDATKNHLWKTTTGGTSWTSIDGSATTSNGLPFGIPVHVVVTHPLDGTKLFAGTDFGVYASTDGGTSWSRYGANLPLVAVRDLYIAPDGSFLRAGTFGRGAWELQQRTLDLNGDGVTNLQDLLVFAKFYGQTTPTALAIADLDYDGKVDDTDLTILLAAL